MISYDKPDSHHWPAKYVTHPDWQVWFEQIYVERSVLTLPTTDRVLSFFDRSKVLIVDDKPLSHLEGSLSASHFSQSKRLLYLSHHKGHFFRQCPGSKPGLVCCQYFVLNLGLQCNMNCSYCYLQSYINTPVTTIYTNINDAFKELETLAMSKSKQSLRIGTGETIDSLSLDPLTGYSVQLIDFFKNHPQWTIEFKTKTDRIDSFLHHSHNGNVMVSWSINPQRVIDHEEHGTASLLDRLRAARRCRDQGFQIAFHIDPMIWHCDWKENYSGLVDTLCHEFRADEVSHISLGALRFPPEQRPMMRERFGMRSWVTQAETFRCRDGKMRYDLQVRNEMFQTVLQRFRWNSNSASSWPVMLCMETPEAWFGAIGKSPRESKEIAPLF